MSEAFPLGVHLILFIFIMILLLTPETFFLLGWWEVGCGWDHTLWFFKSLDIKMVYTLGVYLYLIVHIIVTANYDDGLMFLTFLGEGGYEKNKRFIRDFL